MGRCKLQRDTVTTLLTISGVLVGFGLALLLRQFKTEWNVREVMYLTFIGVMHLRVIQALTVPLIASSLIAAISSVDISISKRVGIRIIVYYSITTTVAAVLACFL